MKYEKTIADDVMERLGLAMFKPICKRCGKNVNWGENLGQSTGVGETYYFHEDPKDCGLMKKWFKPADDRPTWDD